MKKNRFDLSSNIPDEIKRAVRQECGFGCIICGLALYHYHHIEPEWKDAKIHEASGIGLLCGNHHAEAHNGFLSQKSVLDARRNPFCIKNKSSVYGITLTQEEPLIIKLGKVKFKNLKTIIEIDNKSILSIEDPENETGPPRINAVFFDRNGSEVSSIEDNEWLGNIDAFDIEQKGNKFLIRSEKNQIDLILTISPPHKISINQLWLRYNHKEIQGNEKNGFRITSGNTIATIGTQEKTHENSRFGILVKGSRIYLGSDNVASFIDDVGNKVPLSGYTEIDGGEWEIEESDGATRNYIVKSEKKTEAGLSVVIELPMDNQSIIELSHRKQERNSPCKCKSKKIYSECCESTEHHLKIELNKNPIKNLFSNIYTTNDNSKIEFEYRYLPISKPTILYWNLQFPRIMINTSSSFDYNHIGFLLHFWILMKEGFAIKYFNLYDGRINDIIIQDFNEILLSIVAIDRMKREGFGIRYYYAKDISDLINELKMKDDYYAGNEYPGDTLINSIKYIRQAYDAEFMKSWERKKLDELYQLKEPKAKSIGLKLIDHINSTLTD